MRMDHPLITSLTLRWTLHSLKSSTKLKAGFFSKTNCLLMAKHYSPMLPSLPNKIFLITFFFLLLSYPTFARPQKHFFFSASKHKQERYEWRGWWGWKKKREEAKSESQTIPIIFKWHIHNGSQSSNEKKTAAYIRCCWGAWVEAKVYERLRVMDKVTRKEEKELLALL